MEGSISLSRIVRWSPKPVLIVTKQFVSPGDALPTSRVTKVRFMKWPFAIPAAMTAMLGLKLPPHFTDYLKGLYRRCVA